MMNLFVYGALMYEEVWNKIVVGDFEKTIGHLKGYRRLKVKGEQYPGIVAGKGEVSGFIWLGVDNKNLVRLDEFEGEYYERVAANAVDAEGRTIPVNVYRFRKDFLNLLENTEWSVSEFEATGLEKFISQFQLS